MGAVWQQMSAPHMVMTARVESRCVCRRRQAHLRLLRRFAL